jgi:hypothetical protein
MAAGRAVLRRDRGTAPKDVGDVNLWHDRLSEHRKKHQRGRKREKEKSFTGDELPQRRRWRQGGDAGCMQCSVLERSRGKGREEGRRRGANRCGPGVSDRGKRKEERGMRATVT